jgi:hypothetical protein
MFMSHLFLHVLGVDIDLWVCFNEPSEQPSGFIHMNFRMFLLCSFLFDGCTLCWTFWCSLTLWTLWRLFIYFLQELLEAYKWEIICFDKQDDSFFEVQKNISLHLVHHCMQLMTLNILVYPWSNPLLFLDIFMVNVHDYYELHSYEHSDLISYEHSELRTSYLQKLWKCDTLRRFWESS